MKTNNEKHFNTIDMESPKLKFEVQKIYIKEISCKIPQAPNFFVANENQWEPTFAIEMHVKHQPVSNNRHEVTLHTTVSAKTKENTTAFMLDIQQSGIFLMENMSAEQTAFAIKNQCPAVLYPYLSRAIADATVQAGFPALVMPMPSVEQNSAQSSSENNLNNEIASENVFTEAPRTIN